MSWDEHIDFRMVKPWEDEWWSRFGIPVEVEEYNVDVLPYVRCGVARCTLFDVREGFDLAVLTADCCGTVGVVDAGMERLGVLSGIYRGFREECGRGEWRALWNRHGMSWKPWGDPKLLRGKADGIDIAVMPVRFDGKSELDPVHTLLWWAELHDLHGWRRWRSMCVSMLWPDCSGEDRLDFRLKLPWLWNRWTEGLPVRNRHVFTILFCEPPVVVEFPGANRRR